MPTAAGYRALVEQAQVEITPRIMKYLSRRWSEGAIENLSFFAMAVAVYARSVSDPPLTIDVGKVLLKNGRPFAIADALTEKAQAADAAWQ